MEIDVYKSIFTRNNIPGLLVTRMFIQYNMGYCLE